MALSKDNFRGSFSSIAGTLTPPISPEKVGALLRRLGLGSLPVRG